MPTFTYNSDEGIGMGGVGTLYFEQPELLPYKAALTFNIFISTRLVQAHRIRLDLLRAFDLPLRLYASAGYYSTITQNFCGYGSEVTCTPDEDHRQQMRFIRPNGEVILRWQLKDKPSRVETFLGWRGNLYIPGELTTDGFATGNFFLPGPYKDSTYAAHFPAGESGFSSVVQAGVIVDDRDQEVAPDRGYFFEASVRGASALVGSSWDWLGGNATWAVYHPLLPPSMTSRPALVLAHRLVVDASVGDVPTEDLARLGGVTDYIAFGGSDVGRGIREHRLLGKIKLISQSELRFRFAETDLLKQHLLFGVAGFVDAATIGYDLQDWRGEAFHVDFGTGLGFRLLWNHNFAIRLDVGVSPLESYEPRVYIRVGNPY